MIIEINIEESDNKMIYTLNEQEELSEQYYRVKQDHVLPRSTLCRRSKNENSQMNIVNLKQHSTYFLTKQREQDEVRFIWQSESRSHTHVTQRSSKSERTMTKPIKQYYCLHTSWPITQRGSQVTDQLQSDNITQYVRLPEQD